MSIFIYLSYDRLLFYAYKVQGMQLVAHVF